MSAVVHVTLSVKSVGNKHTHTHTERGTCPERSVQRADRNISIVYRFVTLLEAGGDETNTYTLDSAGPKSSAYDHDCL